MRWSTSKSTFHEAWGVSLISGTQSGKRENWLLQVMPWLPHSLHCVCVFVCVCNTHVYTNTIEKFKSIKTLAEMLFHEIIENDRPQ